MDRKTVSARLNENTVWKLEFLKSSMGGETSATLSTTEVLTEAINQLYIVQSRRQQKKTAFDYLMESGFIGGVEGGKNDSTEYKSQVTKRIKKKL